MSNAKSKRRGTSGLPTFVQASIPLDDMESALQYTSDLDVGLQGLVEIVVDGGNVSIKRRDEDRLFQASCTVLGDSGGTFVLTARAAELQHAVNGLLYKYHVICGGDLVSYANIAGSVGAIQ